MQIYKKKTFATQKERKNLRKRTQKAKASNWISDH
jgi:hypothetical protein